MTLGSIWQRVAAVVAVALMGMSLSCSDADPIPPSSGVITLRVQASTTGTGRYESVTFPLTQLVVRPVDPLTETATAGSRISITPSNLIADLASGTAATQAAALPVGRYRLELLLIGEPVLRDTTNPLPPATTCLEQLARIPLTGQGELTVPSIGYVESDFPGWILDVPPGAHEIRLSVDAPALVQLIESSFTCDDSSGTADLIAFDSNGYRNGLLPLLTFQP